MAKFDLSTDKSASLSFTKSNEKPSEKLKMVNYIEAKQYAASEGANVTVEKARVDNADALIEDVFTEHATVKFIANGRVRNSMVIEREPNGRYFEHFALRSYSWYGLIKQIKQLERKYQKAECQLIVEESVEPAVAATEVPLRYQLFVFQGEVRLIAQVDDSASPVKIALFDGSFNPLTEGSEFQINTDKLQAGIPLVPQHAGDFIWWSQTLSVGTQSPFVVVELLDADGEIRFNGFNYAPEEFHKRHFKLERSFIERMDQSFADADKRLKDKQGKDLSNVEQVDSVTRFNALISAARIEQLQKLKLVEDWRHQRLASASYNHNDVAAWRMGVKFQQLLEETESSLETLYYEQMIKSWKAIANLLKPSK